jgi:hypothetical protein
VRDSEDVAVSANVVRDCTNKGIYLYSVAGSAVVNGNLISDTLSYGIHGTGNTSLDFTVNNNNVANVVDYGVLVISGLGLYTVTGNSFNTITGLSRGIYTPATRTAAVITGNVATGVTAPSFKNTPDTTVSEFANSWNASFTYEAAVAPSTGTWKVGDIAWDTTPSAGGKIGWVCTVAGSPGTWKAFGAIDV